MERLNNPVPASAAVSLTTSVVKLSESSTAVKDRQWLTLPIYGLTGTIYILAVASNASAPSSGDMTNYGLQFTSSDKLIQLNLGENMDVYAQLSTGTFSAYPTEWQ
jgi:hypothetical protein